MRDRVVIEERKRRAAVVRDEEGRRVRTRCEPERGILELPVPRKRRRRIAVARGDVSEIQDHAFANFAARRKIREATLRLDKVTLFEGQYRQALVNFGRRAAHRPQPLKLLARFFSTAERRENLRKLEGAGFRVARHHLTCCGDGLWSVSLHDVDACENPLRGIEVGIALESLAGITRRFLAIIGVKRKGREDSEGLRGWLRPDRCTHDREQRRRLRLFEQGGRELSDSGIGVRAGRRYRGRNSGARCRNLIELEGNGGARGRRVRIRWRERPPALHRLPSGRQILASKANFACALRNRHAAMLRCRRRARRRAACHRHDGDGRKNAHDTDLEPIHGTHYKVSGHAAHRANRSSITMKDSIRQRIERMTDRFEEVGRLLATAEIAGGSQQFRELSMEYARLQPLVERYERFRDLESELTAAEALLMDSDASMRALAADEAVAAKKGLEAAEPPLLAMLIPADPRDDHNIFLEVRAGTGGDEAAIFAGGLLRMYARYAESKGLSVELISESPGDHGGFKEIVSRIAGGGVFARFKFESGTHRVQRVPATEAQGRIHTSACTVAILPELKEVEDIDINPADLRIDTYRASGAGGQHVNKTDSAVRITHVPSGIVVECQDERSQHKNRSRAMALLKARLLAAEQAKQDHARAQSRRLQVGSGDRSERIRTYNFPQGRVTDHRINLTLYKLADIMNGDLDELLDALQREHQAEELAAGE